MNLSAFEIRKRFLEYFKRNGHTIIPSASLIPEGDPTILFTNAGMVQFKGIFLNEENRGYSRAASSQKCVRAGGKHNDLENVGMTARHHTFFEMLGNFSFGDYFKESAIKMAWEFLTKDIGLDAGKLYVSVFKDDNEASKIWEKSVGVSTDRIIRLAGDDNFWSMGDTGPCGPCSEILIDQGENVGCGKDGCEVGCECDRFLELWNLVFMQYNRDKNGMLTPLPSPCIDTGMGLERLAAVSQGKFDNYECDLFKPITDAIEGFSGIRLGEDATRDISIKAIADHSRAVTFLIAEGIFPGNEGRNYVLRRIIRRASRHGKALGIDKPFLYKLSDAVIESLGDIYPEIEKARDTIKKATHREEERFLETLTTGMVLLKNEIKRLKGNMLPGDVAFRLYDTFGFPLDLTENILSEDGLKVDLEGFEKAMKEQRIRAKKAWKGADEEESLSLYKSISQTGIQSKFIGYQPDKCSSKISCIIRDKRLVDTAELGDIVEVITPETPFYGESGGQLGDTGFMLGQGIQIEVTDTKKPLEGIIVHQCVLKEGKVKVNDIVELVPDFKRRQATAINHTATHLLHAALRDRLGDHIRQSGSLVTAERLRFDFYHFSPMEDDLIRDIEFSVNEQIRENLNVITSVIHYQEALEKGALAFFGDKYGETVRMVTIGDVSKELCGGTHVGSIGEVGLIKIISESSIAAGIRRIEAITGGEAIKYIQNDERVLKECAALLKTTPKDVTAKISKIIQQQKTLEKEVEKLKGLSKDREIPMILKKLRVESGINIIASLTETSNPNDLRLMIDRLKQKIHSGVVVLGCKQGEKAALIVAVTKDISGRIHAGEIIKELAGIVGGKGGGRAEMAQAGGNRPEMLNKTIEDAYEIIGNMARLKDPLFKAL